MNDFLRITSKDNTVIKMISQLQKSNSKRKKEGLIILEGLRLCVDAVVNGYAVELMIVSDSAAEKLETAVLKISESTDSKYVVPDSLFEKISDTVNPQGILCLCKQKTFELSGLKSNGKYIGLENLQDPSNLGAIARTAEALAIDGIVVSGGVDPYNSKSLRASMGALLRLPIYQTNDLIGEIEKSNLRSYAAVVHSDDVLEAGKVTFCDGSIIIIGNEANGLSDEIISRCDYKITIPMNGNAESLNASVAAAILMWEMVK